MKDWIEYKRNEPVPWGPFTSKARSALGQVKRELDAPARVYESRAFEAAFEDECARCLLSIEVGQTVRYVGDDLVHDKHEPQPDKPVSVCTECWLVLPCDCDS